MVHACNPRMQKVETEDQRQPKLHSKFKVSQGYSEIQAEKKKRKKMCSK